MKNVSGNAELWKPARLSIQGAYTGTKAEVPQVGDPTQMLEFLRYHMSPERWTDVGHHPIHYVFSALTLASNEETHRVLASCGFPDPLFIDTTIKALEDKDPKFKNLRRITIFMLAELDNHLFTTEWAFADPTKASKFVLAWSTSIHEFLGDPTHCAERAAVKVLLAIAHLPCLRIHLPKERWDLIQHFPYIIKTTPPPLQRCLANTTIIPFLKQNAKDRALFPWLGMLWMMYHQLTKDVRKQLREETREIVLEQGSFRLEPYLSLFDVSLKSLQTRIEMLDPLDQATPGLWAKRELMVQAKGCLLSIKAEGGIGFRF